MDRPVEDRLWPRVEEAADLSPNGWAGCWLWTGAIMPNGYGEIGAGGRYEYVHRVAYRLVVGVIPAGCEIDHRCRRRNCVNPAHLEAVTHRENVRRGESPAARHAEKTRCVRGHDLTGANVYRRPTGGRQCRACAREQRRAARAS